jgi:adenylate cyclase
LAGIRAIQDEKFPVSVAVASKDEFGEVARALEEMSAGLAERNLVKSAFARYVSQQVADTILTKGTHPELHGERRRITVLFCDVRGFTALSEKLTPEKVVELLNAYFERMVNAIFNYHGTLDKFLGDGLMAVFGAPIEDNFQEEHALRAAMEMRNELKELNAKLKISEGLELSIGIGINSGMAIVGNIGSSRRMEYTAIGDTVNLASRLESKTKDLGADILISEYTYNSLRGAFSFEFEKMGAIGVKGRQDEVTAYKVPAIEGAASPG